MDTKGFGKEIARLRRKCGLTQAKLAEVLALSDKTVSKWESGLGFPDIATLPRLAEALGVSIDHLFYERKRGITVAGNLIADTVNKINAYPRVGELASITSSERSVGGCAANTAADLAAIDKSLSVGVFGCVGDDESGRFIISKLKSRGIDTSGIRISRTAATSFCNVMSVPSGERTFFSHSGANAEFSPKDIDLDAIDTSILHIGYLMLLEKFDEPDSEYGTVMARFLSEASKRGFEISVDAVSSNDKAEYARTVKPTLPYVDYLIMNEIELCGAFGIEPRRGDGSLDVGAVETAMRAAIEGGVRKKVIVHAREGGFCLCADGELTRVASLNIPKDIIKGNVGAGDAFCAGALYGIYNGYTDKETLEFASGAAATSLLAENSVDGILSAEEIKEFALKYERSLI